MKTRCHAVSHHWNQTSLHSQHPMYVCAFISGHHCCNVFLHTRKQLLTRRAFTIFTHKPPLRSCECQISVWPRSVAPTSSPNSTNLSAASNKRILPTDSSTWASSHFRHKRIIVLCNQLIKVGALFELIRIDRRADLESIFISLAQRGNALIVTRQIIGDIFRDARVIISSVIPSFGCTSPWELVPDGVCSPSS